jgi:hypothetical protein
MSVNKIEGFFTWKSEVGFLKNAAINIFLQKTKTLINPGGYVWG